IAVGMVCVCPGIFPANIRVAPNSPNALVNPKIIPVAIGRYDNGSIILENNFKLFAPSTLAAPTIFLLIDKNPAFIGWYIKGKATVAPAIIAAETVNKMLLPVNHSMIFPIGL